MCRAFRARSGTIEPGPWNKPNIRPDAALAITMSQLPSTTRAGNGFLLLQDECESPPNMLELGSGKITLAVGRGVTCGEQHRGRSRRGCGHYREEGHCPLRPPCRSRRSEALSRRWADA